MTLRAKKKMLDLQKVHLKALSGQVWIRYQCELFGKLTMWFLYNKSDFRISTGGK